MTDQSVGIVPVTKVMKDDKQIDAHEFKCDFDKINYERCKLTFIQSFFSPTIPQLKRVVNS